MQATILHSEYQNKLKLLTTDSLLYIIKDCKEALNNMPDGEKAGYYQDEINYCANELQRRKDTFKPVKMERLVINGRLFELTKDGHKFIDGNYIYMITKAGTHQPITDITQVIDFYKYLAPEEFKEVIDLITDIKVTDAIISDFITKL